VAKQREQRKGRARRPLRRAVLTTNEIRHPSRCAVRKSGGRNTPLQINEEKRRTRSTDNLAIAPEGYVSLLPPPTLPTRPSSRHPRPFRPPWSSQHLTFLGNGQTASRTNCLSHLGLANSTRTPPGFFPSHASALADISFSLGQ